MWWVQVSTGFGKTGEFICWTVFNVLYELFLSVRFVAELRPFPGIQLLDVAGGTGISVMNAMWKKLKRKVGKSMSFFSGDIAFRALASVLNSQRRGGRVLQSNSTEGGDTQIVVCDINPAMLEVGKQRAKAKGWGSHPALVWMEGNAESLEMKSNSMDAYTIAFGIRNVTKVDAALREAHRWSFSVILILSFESKEFVVLQSFKARWKVSVPGVESCGITSFPEIVGSTYALFGGISLKLVYLCIFFSWRYDLYSFEVVPRLGAVIANDRDSYQYLVESIRKFPKQVQFFEIHAYISIWFIFANFRRSLHKW